MRLGMLSPVSMPAILTSESNDHERHQLFFPAGPHLVELALHVRGDGKDRVGHIEGQLLFLWTTAAVEKRLLVHVHPRQGLGALQLGATSIDGCHQRSGEAAQWRVSTL